jgi:hypothetical protein
MRRSSHVSFAIHIRYRTSSHRRSMTVFSVNIYSDTAFTPFLHLLAAPILFVAPSSFTVVNSSISLFFSFPPLLTLTVVIYPYRTMRLAHFPTQRRQAYLLLHGQGLLTSM